MTNRDASDQHDDLRTGLTHAAAGIDVGDPASARDAVGAVVRRRRRRTGVVLGVGAVAILAVGAVVLTARDDDEGTLMSTEPTTVDVPDDTVSDTTSTLPTVSPPSVPAAGGVQVLDRSIEVVAAGPEFAEWIVPWRDGFLAGSTIFPSQPLPETLPEDIAALFPQEVRDLFGGELPSTIDEATTMLSEAGLLDEVTAVIAENQAASEAIYGAPVTEPITVEAQFTIDGATWEPVEMTLPPGASSMYGVIAAGDRLAFAYSDQQSPFTNEVTGTVTVASTTDLVNWATQEIDVGPTPFELPPGVDRYVSAQSLVGNENGWVLDVSDDVQLDVFQLLPEEARTALEAEANMSGYGLSYDESGVTIETGFDSDEPPTMTTYSWDELGISPEVAAFVGDGQFSSATWAATWDGQPTPSDAPAGPGQTIATSAGFLQWTDTLRFSFDGITWTPRDLPDPTGFLSGAFPVEGGIVAISFGGDGVPTLYLLDETGASPRRLDVPGLPEQVQPWTTSRSAVLFDAAASSFPTEPLVIEIDGFRFESVPQTGTNRLLDAVTGEEIVSDRALTPAAYESSPFQFGPDGLAVTDPATGDLLVTIPSDVYEDAARAIYATTDEVEYRPEGWLLASVDGERFVLGPIGGEPRSGVAVNNGRALFPVDDRWMSVELE